MLERTEAVKLSRPIRGNRHEQCLTSALSGQSYPRQPAVSSCGTVTRRRCSGGITQMRPKFTLAFACACALGVALAGAASIRADSAPEPPPETTTTEPH